LLPKRPPRAPLIPDPYVREEFQPTCPWQWQWAAAITVAGRRDPEFTKCGGRRSCTPCREFNTNRGSWGNTGTAQAIRLCVNKAHRLGVESRACGGRWRFIQEVPAGEDRADAERGSARAASSSASAMGGCGDRGQRDICRGRWGSLAEPGERVGGVQMGYERKLSGLMIFMYNTLLQADSKCYRLR
jgi:hypothetical protein